MILKTHLKSENKKKLLHQCVKCMINFNLVAWLEQMHLCYQLFVKFCFFILKLFLLGYLSGLRSLLIFRKLAKP